MNDDRSQADTPAERKLGEHLELLRAEGPEPGATLVRRIMRSARWQRILRPGLKVVGMIAGSVIDGLGALVGRTGKRSR